MRLLLTITKIILLTSLAVWLSACGGGGSGSSGDPGGNPGEFQSLTITPAGGVYTFDNGVIFEAPAGAVDENIDLRVRLLDASEVQLILDSQPGANGKEFIAGVEIEPKGYAFAQPVTLSLPADRPLSPTALPMLLIVDMVNQIYTIDPSFVSPPPTLKSLPNTSVAPRVAAASPYIATKYLRVDCSTDPPRFVREKGAWSGHPMKTCVMIWARHAKYAISTLLSKHLIT